jgi:hypothetical protein
LKSRLAARDIVIYGSYGLHVMGNPHFERVNWSAFAAHEVQVLLTFFRVPLPDGTHRRCTYIDHPTGALPHKFPLSVAYMKTLDYHENRPFMSPFPCSIYQQGEAPRLMWREVQPQHFDHPGGHYMRSSRPRGVCSQHSAQEMQEHAIWQRQQEASLSASNVEVLRTWLSASEAWDAHPVDPFYQIRTANGESDQGQVQISDDCTHWCQPGPLHHWSLLLANMLLSRE